MFFGNSATSSRQSLAFGTLLLCALGLGAVSGFGQGFTGAVYVMSNDTSGNSIVAFNRDAGGALSMIGTFPTGGLGFGSGNDPLGSQGSLLLTSDGHFLIAVNAGSNNISVMQANRLGLRPVGIFSSGGTEPVSLTIYKDLVYVLNAGGTPNITGFELNSDGTLRMLPGSSRPLAGGSAAGPAQVGFTPDGSFLVATEKNTNMIDTYRVLKSGLTAGPISSASSGTTPFGFTFGRSGTLIVTEAAGGPGGTSAASSYQISAQSGELSAISPSVADTQLGACWVTTTNDGRFAYVSNTGSSTVSSYAVGAGGTLNLLNADSGMTGSGSVPLDSAISASGEFLYVLNEGTGTVSVFSITSNGSLMPLAGPSGLPVSAQGIAAE